MTKPELVPPDASERLVGITDAIADLKDKLSDLEGKRKEIEHEILKEEIREEVLYDEEGTVHAECFTATEVEDARAEGTEQAHDVWDALQVYGGHTATCLSGALLGSQVLHPLCTCGWNDAATDLERRRRNLYG